MYQLVQFDHVERLLREAETFSGGGDGLVRNVGGFATAILKFRSISICEVLGYQIAAAVGIRAARTQGFWTPQSVDAVGPGCPGILAEPGRIGILVEYHDDWTDLGWDYAAMLDRTAVARALALCAFDRTEWGSFGRSGGAVYFADLERLLPGIQPETLLGASRKKQIEILVATQAPYDEQSSGMIEQVIVEADRLGLLNEVNRELEKLCSLEPQTYSEFLKLAGHPLDGLLSRFAASVFGRRLNAIAERIGRPTHKVPRWR